MKNHLAERLEFAANFHKETGRHENAALFAEAAAAIRELEARADIDQSAYEELLRAKETAKAKVDQLRGVVNAQDYDYNRAIAERDAAVLAEREACAKVADTRRHIMKNASFQTISAMLDALPDAIRARADKGQGVAVKTLSDVGFARRVETELSAQGYPKKHLLRAEARARTAPADKGDG